MMLAANAHTPSGPSATSPAFGLASPGGASPMPLHSVSTPGPQSAQRNEILCVFAIENSARMGQSFETLLMSYIEPIIRHFRAPPIDPETNQPRPKDAPVVRCGLAIYGDYQPNSTSTVDTRYFTNDPLSFLRELRLIKFEYGGVFRNAVTEGLVSALEMFDQYDDLRASDGPEPERHLILVADSSPHTTGCRCNSIEKYDNFNTSSATQELLQRAISLSLVSPSEHYELVEIVKKVNGPNTEIVEASPKSKSDHVVKLAGFQLPSPVPPPAPAMPTPTSEAVAMGLNGKRGSTTLNGPPDSADLKRETSVSSPAATGSPKLTGPSAKRAKVEDLPSTTSASAAAIAAAAVVAAASNDAQGSQPETTSSETLPVPPSQPEIKEEAPTASPAAAKARASLLMKSQIMAAQQQAQQHKPESRHSHSKLPLNKRHHNRNNSQHNLGNRYSQGRQDKGRQDNQDNQVQVSQARHQYLRDNREASHTQCHAIASYGAAPTTTTATAASAYTSAATTTA
ncbi:Mediator of RNA polymerase II transcription subunit 25 [Haplosporangium bisporale]|nr:Mediator of RNA polymerase II transcription subunit 25 [Haplosporangium bisporale]